MSIADPLTGAVPVASIPVYIYGASDDLVEVEGDIEGADEFNHYGPGPWQARIDAPDGSAILVLAHYGAEGSWFVGAAPYDEETIMPAWVTSLVGGRKNLGTSDYSAVLNLSVPVGSVLTVLGKGSDA